MSIPDVTETLEHTVTNVSGHERFVLELPRQMHQSKSPILKERKRKNAGGRRKRPIECLVAVPSGTMYFSPNERLNFAWQLNAVFTPICSNVNDRMMKENSALQTFQYIDITGSNTRVEAHNDNGEVLFTKINKIGMSQKRNCRARWEVRLKSSVLILVTAVISGGWYRRSAEPNTRILSIFGMAEGCKDGSKATDT